LEAVAQLDILAVEPSILCDGLLPLLRQILQQQAPAQPTQVEL
jgi:hypothetical protein